MFPELEDLARLSGCRSNGTPLSDILEAGVLCGFYGDRVYDRDALAKFLRFTPKEADLLFMDAMRAVQPYMDDNYQPFDRALEVVKATVEAQRARWLSEATSVIEAHDIQTYSKRG